MKLDRKLVEKPWGRTEIPPIFPATEGRRVGEIWFEPADGRPMPMLVKYIFTSEKLSIQVHPSDAEARERGLAQGKSECWYILDADAEAALGLGTKRPLSAEQLRAASLDGSIEDLMDWKPVKAGDFFYVPAGTVHAIGPGISLLEFQQNADVTYRLYDYGRPRELHLDDGIAVARPRAYEVAQAPAHVLVDGPHFSLVRARRAADLPLALEEKQRWVIPLEGRVRSSGETAVAGECLFIEAGVPIEKDDDGLMLVGCEGALA